MPVTNARIMDNAVNADKIVDDAVQTIKLPIGGKFRILDNIGFTLFEIDNDTKEVKVRGTIKKV